MHLYGMMPTIAFENFGDLVVNMEEISGAEKWMQMGEAPIVTVLAESIPRSPCPSYRRDQARGAQSEQHRATGRCSGCFRGPAAPATRYTRRL